MTAIHLPTIVLLCVLFVSADPAYASDSCRTGAGAVPDGLGAGVPLTLVHSAVPGDLDLFWGASCVSTDSDYAVYEGVLGDFTSHVPVGGGCTTGGATMTTITPDAGDRYYLVVPLGPVALDVEGSYGFASNGAPRTQSLSACAVQAVCECSPHNTVFVTSAVYDGNLGGLAGGDANCQSLADAAGLAGIYQAWLSDSTTAVRDRFTQSTLPYVRTDGQVIADDWADLIDNPNMDPLLNPIDRDENGNAVASTTVWTGSSFTGVLLGNACSDWLDGTNAVSGRIGKTNSVDVNWTSTNTGTCDSTFRLYCFEQGHKTVFVTSAGYNGNLGGLAGGDANCQSLADAAGLAGIYKAWLSDSTTAVRDRFTQSTLPYVRTDGQVIADDWADLIDDPNIDPLLNPIDRDENGNAVPASEVWTGTNPDGSPRGGTKCSDWLSNAGGESTRVGRTDRVDSDWTSDSSRPCSFTRLLYCFEQ